MGQVTRRSWFKKSAAVAAGASAAVSLPERASAMRQGKIILAHVLSLNEPDRIKLCLQMGVKHVVSTPSVRGLSRDQYAAAMQKHKEQWAEAGFKVAVYETMTPVPSDNIRRGTPGREEELKDWIAFIEAMGKVGIPVLCYNFGQGGARTGKVILRGGAVTTAHDYEESKKLPPAREILTEDQLWESLTWFIQRIIPVCEKAKVKMGYHPNDPSVSPYRGSAQIMISPAAYRRLFAIADSPYNGVSFCQGNFRSMKYAPGEDIYSVATEFAERGKIQFVHFRDVEGTADTRYHETFHDDGPTDMARMLQCYVRGGFVGPMRTDHAPAMEGEDPDKRPGYAMLGHIFAIGYTKGLMQALNIPYE
ncbi:MAG TPA: mannonate dehydratase [Bryobacteraceae bacterium]|nr:mannonate dehydratase [Bryobacteraceae bacterium]HOQ45253.1 mannonate dehydratase [Bryobacteraceae bacterium]HPQ13868.1 mannonate dehydratase [Bryobacteraceae bacterium]HPU71435.1 mannonate dehydratase [Bryobacteraceae bacterium]